MTDHLAEARTALETGDLERCFVLLNEAMRETDGPQLPILALLGKAFSHAGLHAEAAETFEAAARLMGDEGFEPLKSAALSRLAAGQADLALSLALKANTLREMDADLVYLIARQLHARGEHDMLAHFQNRLTASDNPEHLFFARDLIGKQTGNPFNFNLFKKLAEIEPSNPYTRFRLMAIAREFCDVDTIETEEDWMFTCLEAGQEQIFEAETPYANFLHIEDERLNRLATNNPQIPTPPAASLPARRRAMPHEYGGRIRIGYLSSDFSSTHATMRLLRRVLELHDPARFEITLYCYTPSALIAEDDSGRDSWGRIVRIDAMSDTEAARRIREDGIDILIDLKGHTGGSRCQILNHMAAPVQAAWLGFPASTVNIDLDYIIGDRFVLPDSSKPFYHEHFVRLPGSYQPNDPVHRPTPPPASRQSLGLPEDRFIFASFNAQRKITPGVATLWSEILRRVPDSVLWLMVDGETARANLHNAFAWQGLNEGQLIFAEKADYADHLARVQAADLALDTFPCNGHTTTSDMLWAGLPVLTKRGGNFASRVSESLLEACGLSDFVADDVRDFVDKAVSLVSDPRSLDAARKHLTANRYALSLFDAGAFCRSLEQAYMQMYARAREGKQPDHLDILP